MNPPPNPPPGAPETSTPLPPPRVPDHDLIRRIGRGAYGEVWLARSVTGAYRAVKVVHRQSFDHDRPFEREFEGIRKFEPISRTHDSQVDILHVGRGGDYFYYVMELADDQATGGQIHPDSYAPRTLKSDLLFHSRIPFEECVRIGVALATALEHLHAAGLVHRDVKPSNIIFVNGVPKLADIGLVTGVDATRSHVGTEGFAAPEGSGTAQADLYSLGKVLYEISTGKDRQEFPELPTQLRELPDREGLVELNAVIAKACRHDPKDRYPSAATMRADLELLQGGKSLARLHRTEAQLRSVRRVGALVTMLATVVALGWYWQSRQTRIVADLASERKLLVAEKSSLADINARLAEENRERLIRLKVLDGVRELDRADHSAALVSLTEALILATNHPADTSIHRIRVNQLLNQQPRLLRIFPHPAAVTAATFSPDESQVATACADGNIRLWNRDDDGRPVAEFPQGGSAGQIQFTPDGNQLFVWLHEPPKHPNRVVLLDVRTGVPLFPPLSNLTCAAMSPDGHQIGIAHTNGQIQMIDAASGRIVAQASGHGARVEDIEFSADSRQLITASHDRTARRWIAATGEPHGAPLAQDYPVMRAAFSPDGRRIATASFAPDSGGTIQFQTWDAASGVALGNPILGIGSQPLLAFDRSGRHLLTGDRTAVAQIWDVDSHAAVVPPFSLDRQGRCFDFSADGAWLAIGSSGGMAMIWDWQTGNMEFPLVHHGGMVEVVRFNRDGSQILTAGDDGAVRLWDLHSEPSGGSLYVASNERPFAAVSPDGRFLLMRTYQTPARVQLIDLQKLIEVDPALPGATNEPAEKVSFDRTGNQWVAGGSPTKHRSLSRPSSDGPTTVSLWRREQNQIRHLPLHHETKVRDVFFHENGRQLLTVGDDRMARIWDTTDGTLLQAIRRPNRDAAWVAVSPDLQTAVASFQDERGPHFCLRDVQTGATRGSAPESNSEVEAAAFSPDGMRVATADTAQCGRIWDAQSGQPSTPCFQIERSVTGIEWSPDGRRLLTAGLSSAVTVWDTATGKLALPPLEMHSGPVDIAHFSADGRFIVTRNDENLVRVWDAATGEAVTPLLPHADTVRDVFVTATQLLVSVQNSGMIRVWPLNETRYSGDALNDYAELLARRNGGSPDSHHAWGAAEQAAQLRSLRRREPDLFMPSNDPLRTLRRHESAGLMTPEKVRAAVFHLERLAQLSPQDLTVRAKLHRYRALLIPDRDPNTPPQLLDLSRAYTHSFDLLQRRDFAELPRGRQSLAGVEFDLRGLIKLDHRSRQAGASGPFHPKAVIPVGQRCRVLHFLQATENDPQIEGSTVARWSIHYADGSMREWPVIYGRQVRDWWWRPAVEPLDATEASVVWRGRAPVWNVPGTDGVRLFKSAWTNPQPDLEITRIEFQVGDTSMKPMVVAITAE